MPLAQVNAGDKINASDINQFYSILKGVAASGESVTLIYNAAGSFVLQPSSDPATGTELIQIKNNAGTVQMALSSDGKVYVADGTAPLPGITWESDKDTGLYRISANVMGIAAGGAEVARVSSAGISVDGGATVLSKFTGGAITSAITGAKSADIVAASTTDLSTATGNYAHITGTTTITAFGTVTAGTLMTLEFDAALTLTHNATSLILRDAANYTTVAGDIFTFVSEGGGNWREVGRRVSRAATTLFSRYLNNAALNVSNTTLGTYVDFGGSFTTSVTTLATDKVCIRVQSVFVKQTGGSAAIVVDRGGTKLPAAALTSSVMTNNLNFNVPFAFEYWDTPGAGTFTYKPQLYTDDNNNAIAGNTRDCQYVVEVWR